MERKDLFLNNDLSMMLSREQYPEPDFSKEWEEEQKVMRQDADLIIQNPARGIDAKGLMEKSARYSGTEDYYLKLFTEGSDEEQMRELRSLEYAASMTLLPDAVLIAGGDLIDKEDYAGWAELLYALHYVPLQKAFCYCLFRYKDYCGVLSVIDAGRLGYPQTFLWALLDNWLEWITQVGGHLQSYSDKKGIYERNEKAQALMVEAKAVKDDWNINLPGMIHEVLKSFSRFLSPSRMLAWATKEPLRDDADGNPYSANYNNCLNLIYADLSQAVNMNEVAEEDLNLNMMLLMAESAVANQNVDFGKMVYEKLTSCLLNENFSNMSKKSGLDEKRQRTIAQLVVMVFPDFVFKKIVNKVATCYQGWNLDYREVYNETRREAYLMCSLFRVFDIQKFSDEQRFGLWKNLVDTYLWEYRRCDNEYILREDLVVPFRVAVDVVERLQDDQCREYLHEVMLENVLSIVSLLTIFSECSMKLSSKTIESLLQRVDVEWPSAKLLMEVRGQKMLEGRIENLIGRLRGYKEQG